MIHRDAFGLVNVSAKEVGGLPLLDELGDGARTGMQPGTNAVERGRVGRSVADEHQGVQFGEPRQTFGDLRLAVLSGRIERRRVGIAQTGDLPPPGLEMLFVKIVKTVAGAHFRHLVGGLVVSGQDVDFIAAGAKDFATAFDSAGPGDLVAGGDIAIGLHA
jgi:hypothetical protein